MRILRTSVIICTRNRTEDLLLMLASLKEQTVPPTEIIIIDSSTTPVTENESVSALWNAAQFASHLLYKHTRPSLTYQRNQGVKVATGEVLYFFDDDVVLSPHYLEEMNETFIAHPSYAGGMGTVTPLAPYKPWVNILRALFFLQRNYSHGNFTASGMSTHAYGDPHFKHVEVLGGCCMAYRSVVFKKYSFDETLEYYGYMEDCDFSYRVSRSWTLFYNPRAVLEHRQSPLGRDAVIDNKAMFIANYTYLFFKNFYPTNSWRILAYAWSILGLFLEALLILRKKQWLQGYIKGLLYAYKVSGQIPYAKAPESSKELVSGLKTNS